MKIRIDIQCLTQLDWSINDIASELKVSRETVRKWSKAGDVLDASRSGRPNVLTDEMKQMIMTGMEKKIDVLLGGKWKKFSEPNFLSLSHRGTQ